MDDLWDIDDFEGWLGRQPREILVVLAARTALRCLPLMNLMDFEQSGSSAEKRLLLSTFWSMATALSSGAGLIVGSEKYSTAASSDTYEAMEVYLDKLGAEAINTALLVAQSAGDAAFSAASTGVSATSSAVMSSVDSVFGIPKSFILKEVLNDRRFVSEGGHAIDLVDKRLWSDATLKLDLLAGFSIEHIPQKFRYEWTELKEKLLSRQSENWQVWTDWYEDRIHGAPLIPELEVGDPTKSEFARVTFPEGFYDNPVELNSRLKIVLEKYLARQQKIIQDESVETFNLNDRGLIDRATVSTSSELSDTLVQRNWYVSLRKSALDLKALGENALGRAAGPVEDLVNAVPENISDAKVAILWPAANRLRRLKLAHEKGSASSDEYHPNRLSPEVIDDIDQFVGVYNNLVLGDQNLAEADTRALGPKDVEDVFLAGRYANKVLEIAVSNTLFTEAAQDVVKSTITEDIQIQKNGNLSVLDRLALDNNARVKDNAIRALIIQIRDSGQYRNFEGGFFKNLGGGFSAALMAFVAMQIPAVKALVYSLLQ